VVLYEYVWVSFKTIVEEVFLMEEELADEKDEAWTDECISCRSSGMYLTNTLMFAKFKSNNRFRLSKNIHCNGTIWTWGHWGAWAQALKHRDVDEKPRLPAIRDVKLTNRKPN